MLSTVGIRIAFPLLALLFFGGFLFLLVGLAKAASRATRPQENQRRGCFEGCGLAAVLVFLCFLGGTAFLVLLVVAFGVAAVEHNPVRAIEVKRVSDRQADTAIERTAGRSFARAKSGSRSATDLVCLTFELEGDPDWLVDLIEDVLEVDNDEVWVVQRTETGAMGETVSILDVFLQVDARDLDEIEEEIRRELPRVTSRVDSRFPDGVRVEFREASLPR